MLDTLKYIVCMRPQSFPHCSNIVEYIISAADIFLYATLEPALSNQMTISGQPSHFYDTNKDNKRCDN